MLGAWLYPRLPADQVITVDGKTLRGARAGDGRAVHTQRVHARYLVEDKNADYLLTVKENQPGLFAQLNALP